MAHRATQKGMVPDVEMAESVMDTEEKFAMGARSTKELVEVYRLADMDLEATMLALLDGECLRRQEDVLSAQDPQGQEGHGSGGLDTQTSTDPLKSLVTIAPVIKGARKEIDEAVRRVTDVAARRIAYNVTDMIMGELESARRPMPRRRVV